MEALQRGTKLLREITNMSLDVQCLNFSLLSSSSICSILPDNSSLVAVQSYGVSRQQQLSSRVVVAPQKVLDDLRVAPGTFSNVCARVVIDDGQCGAMLLHSGRQLYNVAYRVHVEREMDF